MEDVSTSSCSCLLLLPLIRRRFAPVLLVEFEFYWRDARLLRIDHKAYTNVITGCTHFAFAARADHVTTAVLICAEI